jgi:hypothetical protein
MPRWPIALLVVLTLNATGCGEATWVAGEAPEVERGPAQLEAELTDCKDGAQCVSVVLGCCPNAWCIAEAIDAIAVREGLEGKAFELYGSCDLDSGEDAVCPFIDCRELPAACVDGLCVVDAPPEDTRYLGFILPVAG